MILNVIFSLKRVFLLVGSPPSPLVLCRRLQPGRDEGTQNGDRTEGQVGQARIGSNVNSLFQGDTPPRPRNAMEHIHTKYC